MARLFSALMAYPQMASRRFYSVAMVCAMLTGMFQGAVLPGPALAKQFSFKKANPVSSEGVASETSVATPSDSPKGESQVVPTTVPKAEQEGQAPSVADTPSEDKPADPEAQALITYNRGVELFQIAQMQAEKGNLNGQKDLLRQAILNFEQAFATNPKLVEAQSNVGFAYLTLKNYRRAQKEFEKALSSDPNHLNTLNGLANALTLLEELPQAVETFEKLTSLDPGNPQFLFNQGSVLQKMGRFPEAQAAYEKALKLDGNDQRSLFNLATLLDNQGKVEEAMVYYHRAKRIDVANPIGLESLHRLEALQSSGATPPPAPEKSDTPPQKP